MEIKKEIIDKVIDHMEYYNNLAPFPVFDTGDIELVKELSKKEQYDKEPVYACTYCKSIVILTDEDGNDYCVKCRNSVNELEEYNIHDYLEKYGELWDLKVDDEPKTS